MLAGVLRAHAALVHDTMKYRGTVPVSELSVRMWLTEHQHDTNPLSSLNLLTTQQAILAAAMEKRILVESQLVLFFSERFFSYTEESPERYFTLPPKMNAGQRKVMRSLFWIAGRPIWFQRICSGLVSTALFSAMSSM
jgi:hypothetical protein